MWLSMVKIDSLLNFRWNRSCGGAWETGAQVDERKAAHAAGPAVQPPEIELSFSYYLSQTGKTLKRIFFFW